MATNRVATSAAGRPTGGLEGFFRLRQHGTEVLAGLTTFFVKKETCRPDRLTRS